MEEVRKKIAEHLDAGDAVKDIAERFVVSKSTVYKMSSRSGSSESTAGCDPGMMTGSSR